MVELDDQREESAEVAECQRSGERTCGRSCLTEKPTKLARRGWLRVVHDGPDGATQGFDADSRHTVAKEIQRRDGELRLLTSDFRLR